MIINRRRWLLDLVKAVPVSLGLLLAVGGLRRSSKEFDTWTKNGSSRKHSKYSYVTVQSKCQFIDEFTVKILFTDIVGTYIIRCLSIIELRSRFFIYMVFNGFALSKW